MAEEAGDGTIKCSLCVRDLTKVTRVNCAQCTAILCIKCFQFGGEAGAHKRGHNYELHFDDEGDTLFNKLWQRDDEQKLITTVHRFKLGNWEEVSQVLSKAGRKRGPTEVQRHFQLYFVLSTLGRMAMKEKEWLERRDQFRDDPTQVYGDPSGRELYYHAVIEALRACKDLPDINDRNIVEQIDVLVREHFDAVKRTERKRKASELGAVLSKPRVSIRNDAFPYGDSDDDAWWEQMYREPREKKELDRYYEEDDVCTEEKCMAEEVEAPDCDLREILRMMKSAGLQDHESLGEELRALKLSTIGEDRHEPAENESGPSTSTLERPEPQQKRAKIELPDVSDRDHLAVDLNREVLMDTVIKDEKIIAALDGKKTFMAQLDPIADSDSDEGDDLASSYDEAEDLDDEGDDDEEEYSSATDSDSEGVTAVFDYEAYEARMKEAGYNSDDLYSDWDEESKEAITEKLRELAQKGLLGDSSEEGDDEDEEKEEEKGEKALVEGLEESAEDDEESASMNGDKPGASGLQRAHQDSVPCGLEEEAETSQDDEEQEVEEKAVSDDDESDSSSSSSAFSSQFESETEQLDVMFGAPAMRMPKAMLEAKKKGIRSIKFYELGSDNEYHTMDEEAATLPLTEMRVGERRRKAIAKKLRRQQDKYYDSDPLTGRLIAKMPRPSMSPGLEAEVEEYGRWEYALWRRQQKAAQAAASSPRAAADEDDDMTPEARFGDDVESQASQVTRSDSQDSVETTDREHPAFQKYLMEHIVDDVSDCSSSDCESITSEVGVRALEFLGYPLESPDEEEGKVNGGVEPASEGEDGDDEDEEDDEYEDANDEVMEHDGGGEQDDVYHQASEPPGDAATPEKLEVKQEEPSDDGTQSLPVIQLQLLTDAHNSPDKEVKEEDRSVKDEEKSEENAKQNALEEPANEASTHSTEEEEREEATDGDSDDALYQLAEAEDETEADGLEDGDETASDEECFRDIEGLEHRCACSECTRHRWSETLGEREHDLWAKIRKSGLSVAEVKEVLRNHFVVNESDTSESSSSENYYSEDEEPLEVYVDAIELNDNEWKIDLTSAESPIPVLKDDYRVDDSDVTSSDEEPLLEEADDGVEKFAEEEKMDVADETVDRPESSARDETLAEEESIYGLEEELDEDEEDDKDKTPPMLQGEIKKEAETVDAPYDLPRSPILVIKKVHARGRTNLKVETRPRTPADDVKDEEEDEKKPSPSQPPAKKKKIPREFQLLYKDNEIRQWEESQAKNLKERATRAFGTGREKWTRCGVEVSLAVDDSYTELDPRKNKSIKKETDKPTCSKNRVETPENPLDELPRSSRRVKITKESKRRSSGSPKKNANDNNKGKKRPAELVDSEKEESSDEDEEEDEETNGGDEGKSPQKRRRKHKRVSMSKKERKAKWDKKIQNRKAREERKVQEKKAVISSIEFFEQHELTFFSNVFRRIAFDYEDRGFRNRVNYKSYTNEIFNMGYNQERDDFEIEYYNDAEQIISRLNITNHEGGMPVDMETEIKLAKVDRYLRVLQERRALRNQAAEYETIPDFLQLCKRMNSERRKLKDIIRSRPDEEKFDAKLSSVLARDELLEMKQAKTRLLKIRSRTEKLRELHAAGTTTLEGHESIARFKPRAKFGRTEEQKKVDERERGTLLEFDEKIAGQLERLSLVCGHAADEERASPTQSL